MKRILNLVNSQRVKSWMQYGLIIGCLMLGFYIGRQTSNYPPKPIAIVNPLTNIQKIESLSIAVNENQELMLIDRKTGQYMVYADNVGKTIYKLYSNKIYQDIQSNE